MVIVASRCWKLLMGIFPHAWIWPRYLFVLPFSIASQEMEILYMFIAVSFSYMILCAIGCWFDGFCHICKFPLSRWIIWLYWFIWSTVSFCVQSHRLTKHCCLDSCKQMELFFCIPELLIHKDCFIFVVYYFLFQDLPSDLKGRNESKKFCNTSLASEFPDNCKFYPADTKDDLHKVMPASSLADWYFYHLFR